MPITALTAIPNSITSPSTFNTDMDTHLSELPTMIAEMNALEVAGTLGEVQDTSTSSVAIGTGAKSFTVTAGKSFVIGMTVTIADDAAPATNYMIGIITAYSGTTLDVTVSGSGGSGTKTAWTISQSAPGGATLAANTFTGLQTFAAGADIASAGTIDLTAATGNTVVITGTTTTTALTMTAGQQMLLLPSGAWPLTYNATTMNINGGASYTCAAGDRIYVAKDLAGVIRVNVFKQDGTAVVAAGGGSLVYMSKVTTASSASTISFTDMTGYDAYLIRLFNVVCATTAVYFRMRTSTDNGSSYDTGSSDYLWYWNSILEATLTGGAQQNSFIQLTSPTLSTAANAMGCSGEILVVRPSESTYTAIKSSISYQESTANGMANSWCHAIRQSAADVDAVQLSPSVGNFEDGSIAVLYGIKTS